MTSQPGFTLADYWMAFVRLLALVAIGVGLSFGAQQTYFTIGTSRVFGKDVDPDLKLAFIGIFNKSLDVLVLSALEYTLLIILTRWMIMPRQTPDPARKTGAGVALRDFDLKDELTKPWMTIIAFIIRCRQSGLTYKSVRRLLLCFLVSISVILLGVAINTIVIPKDRWYPDPDYNAKIAETDSVQNIRTVQHPKMFLRNIDWDNYVAVGQNNTGSRDDATQYWLDALLASLAIQGLSRLVPTVAHERNAWQHVYTWRYDESPPTDLRLRWVVLNTAFKTTQPVETFSMDDDQPPEIYNWLKGNRHSPTTKSMTWTGNLTLIVPAMNTFCMTVEDVRAAESISIKYSNATDHDPTFAIQFGPSRSANFSSTDCRVTVRQALFPFAFWQGDKFASISANAGKGTGVGR